MKKFLTIFLAIFLMACTSNNNEKSTLESTNEIKTDSITVNTTSTVGEKITADPGYNQCIETARYTCGNNFINAYALNNSSTEICDQFGDENLKNSCKEMVITETAKKTLDSDRCNSLPDNNKRISCQQTVLMMKGVKNADPTICSNIEITSNETDSLENIKDRCVIHIINELEATEKTKGLCGLIISEDTKISCETKIQEQIDIQKLSQNPEA